MTFWSLLVCEFIINMLGAVMVYLYTEESSWRCFLRNSRQDGALTKKGKEVSNDSREMVKMTSGSSVCYGAILEATGVGVQ